MPSHNAGIARSRSSRGKLRGLSPSWRCLVSELVESPSAAPVTAAERIGSMDVLRGAALLGIALMNIVFSGLPMAADFNPKVSGGATGLNLAAFFTQYIFFDGKMRGLFSMMFGASTWLLVRRLTEAGAGVKAAEIVGR